MLTKNMTGKIRVGDLLVEEGVISNEQLEYALKKQTISGGKLGKTLITLGFVDESILLNILSKQLDIPFVDIKTFSYSRDDVRSLKETIARRFRVSVLKKTADKVILGMSDPSDIFCLDEVEKFFGLPVEPVIVRESELLEVLDTSYGESEKIASLVKEINEGLTEESLDIDDIVQDSSTDEAPVAKLLLKIFEEAIKYKASDIHIEPDEKVLRIRQRIDGVLSEQVLNEKRVASALVVKLKLMSSLDISEKRIPQDGRFNLKIKTKNIDVRISTMPIQYGESVVMRLLAMDEGVKSLEEVGMDQKMMLTFRKAIARPYGLILVTGPTGSGKTTSLYAALSELNCPDKKIITVEDPVEYRLPRLSQVQINEKIGLSFSKVLRSTLRQDPDILLVGEIRDGESAEIALRAAMTGHLVLSTLHTNDAISSALRLIDMGVDPFLVASSLKTIVAQRLVRKLCPSCKRKVVVDKKYHYMLSEKQQNIDVYQANGCVHCLNTGYRGRVGVFEYLTITDELASTLREGDIQAFTELALASEAYSTLSDSVFSLVEAGHTSLDEMQRIFV
ncbi:MSHA biogenesis protein MshE [Candidatus Endobugula sertula]|uniref:MSHA biogenesis protein MshE n=1 Tax=Candidatus Endobugula sertula TaxID=62101 RepID=A0A1D2QP17_9GAMM|nr:MSHA biogenesis protein MshE [Candidatus Endobugula sertula]